MNKTDSIQNLAKALAAAQREMKAAPMDSVNTFFKSKYADLGAIIESSREPLAKNGLSISQLPFAQENKVGVETILMHESGEWLASELSLPLGEVKGKSLAQEIGSIITYLRRYAFAATVGAYADEDTDGQGTGQSPARANVVKIVPLNTEPAQATIPQATLPPAIRIPSHENGGNGNGGSALDKLRELETKFASKTYTEKEQRDLKQQIVFALKSTAIGSDEDLRHALRVELFGENWGWHQLEALKLWLTSEGAKKFVADFVAKRVAAVDADEQAHDEPLRLDTETGELFEETVAA